MLSSLAPVVLELEVARVLEVVLLTALLVEVPAPDVLLVAVPMLALPTVSALAELPVVLVTLAVAIDVEGATAVVAAGEPELVAPTVPEVVPMPPTPTPDSLKRADSSGLEQARFQRLAARAPPAHDRRFMCG